MVTSLELGAHLARLRDKVGIKQVELADKLPFGASVLSRIESGERPASAEELSSILEAIDTEEAARLRDAVGHDWEILPRPPLGHPEEPVLWDAELACQGIAALLADPQNPQPFDRRLRESLAEIRVSADAVLEREYSVALVGNIGAGKTTALCRMTGLEVVDDMAGKTAAVLDVGAGGITLCDVQLAQGPQYGIIVEPKPEAEFYREVREFARSFTPGVDPDQIDEDGDDDASFSGTSREVERAIRNMSGLTVKRIRLPDGSRERTDPVREMARGITDPDELAVAIRAKMNLQKRTRREIWYPNAATNEPRAWLSDIFRRVNNGRHPEFSLPNRVDVLVPWSILTGNSDDAVSIRLIDTRGIDSTAERADLEAHFSNPRALVVMCSTFNDAPSASVQQLLDRAVKGGFPELENKSAVLVLPRSGEALAVKDDDGFAVDGVLDGYEIKGEEAIKNLKTYGLPPVTVEFFNSFEDEPQRGVDFLLDLVGGVRQSNLSNLREVIDGANNLIQNRANERVRAVQKQAANQLKTFLDKNKQITPFTHRPEESLIKAIRTARYASWVRASVRREGDWQNLDLPYQLGYGTRAMAFRAISPKVRDFHALASNLMETPDYEEAADLIGQARRLVQTGVNGLYADCQLLGRTVYAETIKRDAALWARCVGEWGQGSGYKTRVLEHHQKWFEVSQEKIDERINSVVETLWRRTLEPVLAILEAD